MTIYERAQANERSLRKRINRERKQIMRQEMKKCTFKPRITPHSFQYNRVKRRQFGKGVKRSNKFTPVHPNKSFAHKTPQYKRNQPKYPLKRSNKVTNRRRKSIQQRFVTQMKLVKKGKAKSVKQRHKSCFFLRQQQVTSLNVTPKPKVAVRVFDKQTPLKKAFQTKFYRKLQKFTQQKEKLKVMQMDPQQRIFRRKKKPTITSVKANLTRQKQLKKDINETLSIFGLFKKMIFKNSKKSKKNLPQKPQKKRFERFFLPAEMKKNLQFSEVRNLENSGKKSNEFMEGVSLADSINLTPANGKEEVPKEKELKVEDFVACEERKSEKQLTEISEEQSLENQKQVQPLKEISCVQISKPLLCSSKKKVESPQTKLKSSLLVKSLVSSMIEEFGNDTPAFTNVRRSPSLDFRIVLPQKSPAVSDYNYTASEEQKQMVSTFLTPSDIPLLKLNQPAEAKSVSSSLQSLIDCSESQNQYIELLLKAKRLSKQIQTIEYQSQIEQNLKEIDLLEQSQKENVQTILTFRN